MSKERTVAGLEFITVMWYVKGRIYLPGTQEGSLPAGEEGEGRG